MADKDSSPRRLKAKAKNKNNKKKIVVIILSSFLLIVTIVLIIIFIILPNLTKNPNTTNEILSSHGYESYFYFGQNQYNRTGECINGGFSYSALPKDCVRENMDLYNGDYRIRTYNDNEDYPLEFNYRGNLIEHNPLAILEIEKFDDTISELVVFGYIGIDLIYIRTSAYDDDFCYSQILSTPDWLNDEHKMCSSDDATAMNSLAETIDDDLEKIGITLKDLDRYHSDYLKNVVAPKIETSKKSIDEGLSFIDTKKELENSGYRFNYSKDLNALFVSSVEMTPKEVAGFSYYLSMGDTYVLLLDNNSKVTKVMYKNYDNKSSLDGNLADSGFAAFWIPDSDEFYGATTSQNCMVSVDYPSLESRYDPKCSKEDMDGIESISSRFRSSLSCIGITRFELVKFAENYI